VWELNDAEARDFMVAFHNTWLSQARSHPAKALRETQLSHGSSRTPGVIRASGRRICLG
jgi:CHAT domain-containing protein